MTQILYPFTEAEFQAAAQAWGCNCGPAALAYAMGLKLDAVRRAIPEFETKRYTSPTMMKQALAALDRQWVNIPMEPRAPITLKGPDKAAFFQAMFDPAPAIVRIQFCGPWTAVGMNPRWAYTHTHWIVTACDAAIDLHQKVFDCNGGVRSFASWQVAVLPHLIPERGDGKWYPTHVWRIAEKSV